MGTAGCRWIGWCCILVNLLSLVNVERGRKCNDTMVKISMDKGGVWVGSGEDSCVCLVFGWEG